MSKLNYNANRDQMELCENASNAFEAQFIVPPVMEEGDTLTPFMFKLSPHGVFYFFGRYNHGKDMVEFTVAGPSGLRYKLSLADGNSPYGWKVKKHGIIRGKSTISLLDHIVGTILESFLVMAGKKPSRDLTRDLIQADAFAAEEIIGLPLEMMRISHRDGIMDAKEKCIEKWSFFGPSLPAAFCRCRLRLTVYDDSMPTAAKQAESDDSDEDFVADEIHKGRNIT